MFVCVCLCVNEREREKFLSHTRALENSIATWPFTNAAVLTLEVIFIPTDISATLENCRKRYQSFSAIMLHIVSLFCCCAGLVWIQLCLQCSGSNRGSLGRPERLSQKPQCTEHCRLLRYSTLTHQLLGFHVYLYTTKG